MTDTSLSVVGESRPELDPYYIRFSSDLLDGDHMITTHMPCQKKKSNRYICQNDSMGEYQHATIIYRRRKGRRFDFRLFVTPAEAPAGTPEHLEFSVRSDGRFLIFTFGAHRTERYLLAP